MALIERLKEIQGERSQQQFADELGIDQSLLSRLYSGEISLGTKTARRLAEKLPELKDEIAVFLLGENMHVDNVSAA